jgi:hypothetical protein
MLDEPDFAQRIGCEFRRRRVIDSVLETPTRHKSRAATPQALTLCITDPSPACRSLLLDQRAVLKVMCRCGLPADLAEQPRAHPLGSALQSSRISRGKG